MNFTRTLRKGQQAENFIQDRLAKFNIESQKNEDKKNLIDYDLKFKIGKEEYRCEVKYDIMAARTSNLAIEYWNSRLEKPSGILATKAEIWAVVINDCGNMTLWMISTEKLRKFIDNNNPKAVKKNVGDGNANILLYDDSFILEEFTRLDDISEEKKFKKKLKEVIS